MFLSKGFFESADNSCAIRKMGKLFSKEENKVKWAPLHNKSRSLYYRAQAPSPRESDSRCGRMGKEKGLARAAALAALHGAAGQRLSWSARLGTHGRTHEGFVAVSSYADSSRGVPEDVGE